MGNTTQFSASWYESLLGPECNLIPGIQEVMAGIRFTAWQEFRIIAGLLKLDYAPNFYLTEEPFIGPLSEDYSLEFADMDLGNEVLLKKWRYKIIALQLEDFLSHTLRLNEIEKLAANYLAHRQLKKICTVPLNQKAQNTFVNILMGTISEALVLKMQDMEVPVDMDSIAHIQDYITALEKTNPEVKKKAKSLLTTTGVFEAMSIQQTVLRQNKELLEERLEVAETRANSGELKSLVDNNESFWLCGQKLSIDCSKLALILGLDPINGIPTARLYASRLFALAYQADEIMRYRGIVLEKHLSEDSLVERLEAFKQAMITKCFGILSLDAHPNHSYQAVFDAFVQGFANPELSKSFKEALAEIFLQDRTIDTFTLSPLASIIFGAIQQVGYIEVLSPLFFTSEEIVLDKDCGSKRWADLIGKKTEYDTHKLLFFDEGGEFYKWKESVNTATRFFELLNWVVDLYHQAVQDNWTNLINLSTVLITSLVKYPFQYPLHTSFNVQKVLKELNFDQVAVVGPQSIRRYIPLASAQVYSIKINAQINLKDRTQVPFASMVFNTSHALVQPPQKAADDVSSQEENQQNHTEEFQDSAGGSEEVTQILNDNLTAMFTE